MVSNDYQDIKKVREIAQLEAVFASSAEDMQSTLYDIQIKGIADFLPIGTLKKKIETKFVNYEVISNLMGRYMKLTDSKSNKDYEQYFACVQIVQRILLGKLEKIENENIKKINDKDLKLEDDQNLEDTLGAE